MESNTLRSRGNASGSEDINKKPDEGKTFLPDKTWHKPSESILSSNYLSTYTELFNVALIVSLGGVAALLVENINKYGLLIDSSRWWFLLTGAKDGFLESYLVCFLLYSLVPASISLLLEKSIAKNKIPGDIGMICHFVNIIHIVIVPIIVIPQIYSNFTVVGTVYVAFLYTALFLKLSSYALVNCWSRKQRTSRSSSVTENNFDSNTSRNKDFWVYYPDNLTWIDMAYFFFAPTLSYELNFPRTDRIEKRFVLRSFLEIILLLPLTLSLSQQWLSPYVVEYASSYSSNGGFMKRTELMLKAVVPMNLVCSMAFYMVFQSYLNILAELLRFADRTFYRDWWNATNTDDYWRKWNTRCYIWALRHVYIPLIELGYSKRVANFAVWGISGFFHEYVFCLALNTFELGYFFSLLFQGYYGTLSRWIEKFLGPRMANLFLLSMQLFGNAGLIMLCHY